MKKVFSLILTALLLVAGIFSIATFAQEQAPATPTPPPQAEKEPLSPSLLIEKWMKPSEYGSVSFPEDLVKGTLAPEVLTRIAFTYIMDQYPDMTLEDFDKILVPDLLIEKENGQPVFHFGSGLTDGGFRITLDAVGGTVLEMSVDSGGGNG